VLKGIKVYYVNNVKDKLMTNFMQELKFNNVMNVQIIL
jgi:hypothetical protein